MAKYIHCEGCTPSQGVGDSPASKLLNVLLGVFHGRLWWLWGRWRSFHQLHEIMAIHLLHDPKATSPVVANAFLALASPRVGLSYRGKKKKDERK